MEGVMSKQGWADPGLRRVGDGKPAVILHSITDYRERP
jgi:hypothetical protein